MQSNDEITMTGFLAATYYKYFAQNNNPYIVRTLPLNRISAKTLYNKNKKAFDKFVTVYNKYNIDIIKYLKFVTIECGKTEKDIPEVLLSQVYLSKFIEYLQVRQQYYKIYKYFLKSANNIVDDCIRLGYTSVKEYLRYLISNNKLVNEYVAGRISCYYLCAIQNFKKIVPKMDVISQHEFSKILMRYDKYNLDVQEAFRLYKSNSIKPIKFTEELLWSKLNNNK